MPSGLHKSRTQRRVRVKTPKNRVVIHYRVRTAPKAACAGCGKLLPGAKRGAKSGMSSVKSSKRSDRAFSNYCSACSRRNIIEAKRK